MQSPLFLKENKPQMTRLTMSILLSLISVWCTAADHNFSFNAIPAPLLENSNTVIRYSETVLEIRSAGKAVMKVSFALTVLKDNAVENAILFAGYNKFTSIRHLEGIVYDKNGDKVERVEQDQFFDFSAIPGFATYDDNRVIACRPRYQTVPFTVSYNYEIVYNGILDFPDYYLVRDFNIAVEQADLIVRVPDSIGIRYFPKNIASTCKIEKQKSIDTYSWSFNNIPSLRKEPFSPPIMDIAPAVLLAPRSFELKKKRGDTNSWKSLGSWYYELIQGRDDLNEETRQKINTLTSELSDTLEKIKKLYHYLQDKTRYVSIRIGIGGWQPEPASEVDRLGYGDCKALTNYMKALLKAVGIDSYYTLVNAGNDASDIVLEFPSSQFNHVILCVPLKDDTLWLECTSQDLPVGYLGTFTDDRSVLLIRETGGFLCHTPVYDQKMNFQNRMGNVQLQGNGDATMNARTISQGLFFDTICGIMHQDETDQRKELVERISAANFILENFNLKENDTGKPVIEATLNLTITNMGIHAGALMLFMPNQLTRENELSSQVIRRNNPVEIRRSISKTDTIYYKLPGEFSFTGNHISQTISSGFGRYRAISELNGNTLRYVRTLEVYKGKYPKEAYEDLLGFFEKVANADAKKIALKPL